MLIIYGDGISGINAESFYSEYKRVCHREARYFTEPEKCEAFAIESSKTSHILRIREAYIETGIPEVSRNRPEPPKLVQNKKNLTIKHIAAGVFAILDGETEMTRVTGKKAAEEYVNAYSRGNGNG